VPIAVHPVELTALILLWILAYVGTCLMLTALRADPPVGWSVGPFGISAIFLRAPSALYCLWQLLLPALVAALVLYFGLFYTSPPPILGLPHTPGAEVVAVLVGAVGMSGGNMRRIVRDVRYPLWGEARMLHAVQHARALGGKVYFTTFGRIYLREEFDTTPQDLLQALR
jgi:hypothetical protein